MIQPYLQFVSRSKGFTEDHTQLVVNRRFVSQHMTLKGGNEMTHLTLKVKT